MGENERMGQQDLPSWGSDTHLGTSRAFLGGRSAQRLEGENWSKSEFTF